MKDQNSKLQFYINNEQKYIEGCSIDPRTSLLEYLRQNKYHGCKYSCGEGYCGSCTVVIADYEPSRKMVRYRTANACLLPLCSVHNKQVITVEGLGSPEKPHPIQVSDSDSSFPLLGLLSFHSGVEINI
jgi:xanthine dehydrogenase/oxidase